MTVAEHKSERGNGNGRMGLAAATGVHMAGRALELLERIRASLEDEPDYDQTFVVGGQLPGPTVIPIQLPRTLKHVEITFALDVTAPTTTTTDIDKSSTTAVAAAIQAALPGVAGATTYITGFEVTGQGATAGSTIAVTVTGILGGTKTYELVIPAGVGTSITPLTVEFSRPIPASAPNTGITVAVPSFGAGNTAAAVTAHGFQQTTGSAPVVHGAVLAGNLPLALAQQAHSTTGVGASAAIVASGGGSFTARDFLDGSGYLTVLFADAGTVFANIRVRSLDKTQTRPLRT